MSYVYYINAYLPGFVFGHLILVSSLFSGCIDHVSIPASNDGNTDSSSALLEQRESESITDFRLLDDQVLEDIGVSSNVGIETDIGVDLGPPENCLLCQDRATLTDGLNTISIPLQISPIEADYSIYIPILWTSDQGRSSNPEAGISGHLVPGIMGYINGSRISVWGHDGLLTDELDSLPDSHLFRIRLMHWLLGANGNKIGFLGGHREWLNVDSFSNRLRTELIDEGVSFQTLVAPLQESALDFIDTLIIGNPWDEVSTVELDLIMDWLATGRGLIIFGCQWSWEAYNPVDDLSYPYAISELGQRLGWSFYSGVIIDPNSPTEPHTQPTYRVHSIDDWPHNLPD